MITYNSIADRDDKAFISKARRALGRSKFDSLIPEVRAAFKLAYDNEPNKNKKPSVAKRAANMVYTSAINNKI